MEKTHPTSFRLSVECKQALRDIGESLGLSDSSVMELAVRSLQKHGTDGLFVPKPKRRGRRSASSGGGKKRG